MRVQVAIPESHVSKDVLDAALESVTRLNESMLAKGDIPPIDHAIANGVRWKPEPPGQEHFDHGALVLRRGWGDCDDLAPWKAATLRHTGEDPNAIAVVRRSGPKRWHAVVQRGDGSIDDPSADAGMGKPSGHRGAWLPTMPRPANVSGAYIVRPQVAIRPVPSGYQARVDIPWSWREHHMKDDPSPSDVAMAILHHAPTAPTALTGAILGGCRLADVTGFAEEEHLARLAAISDCASGMGYRELCAVHGTDEADAAWHLVGSLFGSLARAVSTVTKPIANIATRAVSAVPQFAQSIVRSVASAPAFLSHFASDPRGAVMTLAHDLGSIKVGPIPLGATNLIWLADEAARRGLGQQLYSSLSQLGPKGIPSSPATQQAEKFVHDLAANNPQLQAVLKNTVPSLQRVARSVAPVVHSATPAQLDQMYRTYHAHKLRPAMLRTRHPGIAAIFA